MKRRKTAGALKSWTCVALLTFLLPAAGFEISAVVFSASAAVGERLSSYFITPEPRPNPVSISCGHGGSDKVALFLAPAP